MASSTFSLMAAAAAVAPGVQSDDLDLPDLRALFEILPGKLARQAGFKLILERARFVVAGDVQHAARRQRVERSKNTRVPLAGAKVLTSMWWTCPAFIAASVIWPGSFLIAAVRSSTAARQCLRNINLRAKSDFDGERTKNELSDNLSKLH